MVKMIHSADMHLDAPMSSSKRQKSQLMRDFKSLIDLANEKNADLLLISGDLFDSPFPEDSCVREAIDILGSCRSEVFISPGNHDPYFDGSVYHKYSFPDNVHIFTDYDTKYISAKCGADVYGYAFTSFSEKKHPLREVQSRDRINIYSIHADLGVQDSNYAPVFAHDIESTGADYVALGHIHKRMEIQKAGGTSYAYCGCLSPKDFGECGRKGVIYGEFDITDRCHSAHYEFISITDRHYEIISMNLTGITTPDELCAKIYDIIAREGYGKSTSLRIIFKGERSMDISLSSTFLKDIEDKLFELEFEDRSVLEIQEKDFENDPTVKGELYSIMKDKLHSDDAEEADLARLAFRMALSAINNENVLEISEMEDIDV